MNNIFNTLIPDNLNHFYLIEGDVESSRELLISFLDEREYVNEGNVLDEYYESLNVEANSILQSHHSEKSGDGKKIIIVRTKDITSVAEHALLKMCEDPTEDTHIFILIPSISSIPDTLRSRAQIIKMPRTTMQADILAVNFMKVSKNERMDIIAEIIKKYKDDKEVETSAPLRDEARSLVDALATLAHKTYKFPYSIQDQEKLSDLINAHRYLSTSGASVKMILEQLALVL